MKWYKGDFHTHTVASDGKLTQEDIPLVKEKNQLDFIFLTDHNQLPKACRYDYLWRGMEVTTDTGHMNVHYIGQEILEGPFETCKGFIAAHPTILDEANISINHPFMEPWDFKENDFLLEQLYALEVICDPTWKTAAEANKEAIDFLNFLQSQGHQITGIGGSDSHLPYNECYEWSEMPSEYGDPATYVGALSCIDIEIIQAIKQGRVYVMRQGMLEISIQEGRYWPGNSIQENQLTYEVKLLNHPEAVRMDIVINNNVIQSQLVKEHESVLFNLAIESDYASISGVAYDKAGKVVGYINPIYKGTSTPRFKTWGEAVEQFKLVQRA